jgi:hypothetical protein
MLVKPFALLFSMLLFCSAAQAQLITGALKQARKTRVQEIRDTIAQIETQAAFLRQEMETQIETLGYERALIFGREDQYFKEGMHQHFSSTPKNLGMHIDRNPIHVALEENHVTLYHLDKALYGWRQLKDKLGNVRIDDIIGEINERLILQHLNELAPAYKEALDTDAALKEKWYQNELTCQCFPPVRKAIETVSLSKNPECHSGQPQPFELAEDGTIPESWILSAYPYPGQFNYYREEVRDNFGYILLNGNLGALKQNYPGHEFQIRWSNQAGEQVFSRCQLAMFEGVISFEAPNAFFEPGQVYEMALVATPAGERPPAESRFCLSNASIFEQFANLSPARAPVSPKVLYQHYFRVSLYGKAFNKMKAPPGTLKMVSDSVLATLTFSEPFGQEELEVSAASCTYFWHFGASNLPYAKAVDCLESDELLYFLATPDTQPVDTLQETAIAAALDHTIDAPFIYDLRKGTPASTAKRYRKAATDSKQHPTKYRVPATYDQSVFLTQAFTPDSINQAHFEGQLPLLPDQRSFEAQLQMPWLPKLKQEYEYFRQAIKDRMEERAQYFYLIKTWQARQNDSNTRPDLDQLRQQEYDNLPEPVRYILKQEIDFPTHNHPVVISGNYKLPGVKNWVTSVIRLNVR